MPTEIGKPFNIDWRGKPPHMLDHDIPVWYRFLSKWGFKFVNLYYDSFVGGAYYSAKKLEDKYLYMWRALNAKRIDALGETMDEVWIIEVSESPGLRAVGQLQVYQKLWLEDPKIDKPHKMILVCAHVHRDVISSAAFYGILTYVMPRNAP